MEFCPNSRRRREFAAFPPRSGEFYRTISATKWRMNGDSGEFYAGVSAAVVPKIYLTTIKAISPQLNYFFDLDKQDGGKNNNNNHHILLI